MLTQEQKDERRNARKEIAKEIEETKLRAKHTRNWVVTRKLWACRKCVRHFDGRMEMDNLPRDKCEAPENLKALAKESNNHTILVAAVCADAAGAQQPTEAQQIGTAMRGPA